MKNFLKNKWFKRGISLLVVAAIVTGGVLFFKGRNAQRTTEEVIPTAIVTRRSITNTVTGSGTVEAYETYNIVPTVHGEIIECNVEEGEWVEEDQVLYMFDTETSDNAISKAENSVENASLSLEQAQENVANLTVTAPMQGVVSNLSLIIGDGANGSVCTITDNTYMIASIPVTTAFVKNIAKGDEVTVGLEKYMTTLKGYVDRIATGSQAGANGAMVTIVEVRLDSPGSITEGTMASATFHTQTGDIEGAEAAALYYAEPAKATAKQSGTVKQINVKNGDWVNKGDVIAVLENSQVENQLKTARMNYSDAVSNLADTRKAQEDYILKAPIAGKVMEKNYKKGDTVAGQNSTTLMVVADTTRMKFTINVDELDVAKITIGQEVTIEADAIEGEVFKGRIETVSFLGSSSSGVTYYPVVVVIDSPGDLIPGMNVSAEIIVESAENVVAVPSGAVSYYDGAYYVTVVGDVEGMSDMDKAFSNRAERGNWQMNQKPTGDMPESGEMPTGVMSERGEMPTGAMTMGNGEGRNNRTESMEMKQNMYDEPLRVEVTTGVSDDDYIEIVTGDISVGMIVQNMGSNASSNAWGGFGGFGGGMPMGGGMPAGRMR